MSKLLSHFMALAGIHTKVNSDGQTELYRGSEKIGHYEVGEHCVKFVGIDSHLNSWGTTDLEQIVERDKRALLRNIVSDLCQ